MIGIKMKQDKWELSIRDEELQFDSRKKLEEVLKYILDLKDKNGRIRKYDYEKQL